METTDRSCGECIACCFAPAVPAIEKPPNVWCRNCIQGEGCAIYNDRPAACALYQCGWLRAGGMAELPLELRPDQCGFIFEYQEIQFLPQYVATLMLVYETRGKALEEETAQLWAQVALEDGELVWQISLAGQRKILYPQHVVLRKGTARQIPEHTTLFIQKKEKD